MTSLLKRLDLYGGNVLIYHKSHRSIQTNFGGIITMLVGIAMTLLIIAFGNDFFYRTNPIFIKQEVDPSDYPNLKINNSNFMFAFRYEDINGAMLDEQGQSFYFEVWRKSYSRNEKGEWETNEVTTMPYSRCIKQNFTDQVLFDEKNIKDFFCIDYNYEKELLGGSWEANFVHYMSIEYAICKEGSNNPYNGLPCNPTNITDSYLSKYSYASFYIQSLFVDPSNYENPITKTIFNLYHIIDKNLVKSNYIYFILSIVESDYGWILESRKQIQDVRYESRVVDINLKSSFAGGSRDKYMGNFIMYLKKTLEKYNRTYTKIQNLAANVGGILKTFTFLMTIIIQIYNYYDFKFEMTDSLKGLLRESCIVNSKNSLSSKKNNFHDKIDKKSAIHKVSQISTIKVNKEEEPSNTLNINRSRNQTELIKETMLNNAFMDIPKRIYQKIEDESKLNKPNSINYSKMPTSSLNYMTSELLCCYCISSTKRMNIKKLSNLMHNHFSSKSIIKTSVMTEKLYDMMFNENQKKVVLSNVERLQNN